VTQNFVIGVTMKTMPKNRVVRKCPQKSMLRSSRRDFMYGLKMCFRQMQDRGKKRKCPTPGLEELRENLQLILSKWTQFLPNESTKELKKLITHVETGCLHDIKVGGGTSLNENVHKHLNGFINKKTVLSPDTALCLLNVFFYHRNKRIAGSKNVPITSVNILDPKKKK
jgi:hypothetical protein